MQRNRCRFYWLEPRRLLQSYYIACCTACSKCPIFSSPFMRRPPSPAKIPTATQGIRPRPRIGTQLHASHVPGSGRMVKMAAAYSIPSSLLVSLSLWCSVCACLPVLSYPNGYPVLPVTSKRRPDASHSWRPLRVLLYLICVTPLPLPRPAHVINLASPQGQHLSHHSPRFTCSPALSTLRPPFGTLACSHFQLFLLISV